MVKLEEREFEDLVLNSSHYVAVPIEVFHYEDERGIEIVTYSFTEKIAFEFEEKFASDPFSHAARDFLYEKLTPVMEELGYNSKLASERAFLEFRRSTLTHTNHPECEIISTLDGEVWGDLPLDEFALDPEDECDRMAVVKRDGVIVCFAGLNDEIDGDGICEITVECDAAFRGHGYGTTCVIELCEYLEARGKTVKYICSDANEASVRTAKKAGFELFCKFMPYVCRLNNPDGTENEEIILSEV